MSRHYYAARSGRFAVAAIVLAGLLQTANAACVGQVAAKAYEESIESTVPSDLDPHLATPPTPTTHIGFSVLVPAHCPGQTFPVIFNYAAWGSTHVKRISNSSTLLTNGPALLSSLDFVSQLPNFGYVVISADPRGLGDSRPKDGGGPQRLMDPNAEIQDARQILDWAYDNAGTYSIQKQLGTGIAKDLVVGTYGVSYGGGFQSPLAALDARIDAMVPVASWYDIYYSIVPGGAIKSAWGGALCLIGNIVGQVYTPYLGALCDEIGLSNPQAGSLRTEADLVAYLGLTPGSKPTAAELRRQQQLEKKLGEASFPTADEVVNFLVQPGIGYFEQQQDKGLPWGFGESVAKLRPVPALFVQGNSDLLFNLTEAYSEYRYFKAAGGDVRLMSINGGHNALAATDTGYCGTQNHLTAALTWFNHYLKKDPTADLSTIAPVCISISDTVGAPKVPNIGLTLNSFPVGSLSGTGTVPAELASATVTVKESTVQPEFVSVVTISGAGKVLAGVPTLGSITVKSLAKSSGASNAVALVATGIKRGGKLIAVDQQVTGFAEGTSISNNPHLSVDNRILLPAVGEQLQDGDEVGLLLYRESYDFNALLSSQTPTSVLLYLEQIGGVNLASGLLTAAGNANGLLKINPYEATLSDIQLPILVSGTYPGSAVIQ